MIYQYEQYQLPRLTKAIISSNPHVSSLKMTNALLFGSTGAVGSQILATLLSTAPSNGASITTISRRLPPVQTPNLHTILESDTMKWGPLISSLSPLPSVVFNTVGTTLAAAGSLKAQWAIDHDLCVENAQAAKGAGVKTYVYCSSRGTSTGSWSSLLNPFARTPYARMKRGVEEAIRECEFEHAVILRPGMILGRDEPKYKWLEDAFGGLRYLGQGVMDKCGKWCCLL